MLESPKGRIISKLDMLIFDIGANVGNYAKENYNASTKIICVEASPKTFLKLKENTKENENIILENFAVSNSKDSHITFYECSTDTLSTLDLNWLQSDKSRFGNLPKSVQQIRVPCISIDSLITKYGVPDLLKVDVEGAEDIVLQSLTTKVPVLCFEWASEWRTVTNNCMNHLVSLGYKSFDIQLEDKYTYRPSNFLFGPDDVRFFIDSTEDKNQWGMVWAQ